MWGLGDTWTAAKEDYAYMPDAVSITAWSWAPTTSPTSGETIYCNRYFLSLLSYD